MTSDGGTPLVHGSSSSIAGGKSTERASFFFKCSILASATSILKGRMSVILGAESPALDVSPDIEVVISTISLHICFNEVWTRKRKVRTILSSKPATSVPRRHNDKAQITIQIYPRSDFGRPRRIMPRLMQCLCLGLQ